VTDLVLNADDNTFAKSDAEPQTFEQRQDTDELNMSELDEVNGGLLPLLVGAAYVGLVGYAIYRNTRH